MVYLKGYGFVKVFRTVSRDGNAEHWATDDLQMEEATRNAREDRGWGVEVYYGELHRTREQKSHLLMALRVFLRLEAHRLRTGIGWYGMVRSRASFVREAIRAYLVHPRYTLGSSA